MPGGDIKIACSPSAALELCEEDIDGELIRHAKVLVIDGFMLERRSLIRHILELADSYGTAVALDISSVFLATDMAVEILTYARAYPLIIFMNEDEARAFYRVLSRTEAPSQEEQGLCPALINLFKDFTANDIFPVLAVKLGIKGAVIFANGNVYNEETIPIIPLETTGAGDTFCAAFLSAWIRNKSLCECAALGNKAARVILDVKGTQTNPKALKQLKKLLT
jgi:sugar/nucleoside kinase (ribokinase family)